MQQFHLAVPDRPNLTVIFYVWIGAGWLFIARRTRGNSLLSAAYS